MPSTKYALVVDDIEFVRNAIAQILKQEGYQVIQASNGDEAIECFQAKPKNFFSLITMDYQMPFKNGAETIVEIRKRDLLTPIICISASLSSMKKSLQEKEVSNDNLYFIDKDNLTEDLPKVLMLEI